MNFSEYVAGARTTAIYPGANDINGVNYALTGLMGEIGETFNIVQKCMRDDNWLIKEDKINKFVGEYGGVMWFLSQAIKEVQYQFSIAGYEYEPDFLELSLEELFGKGEEAKAMIKEDVPGELIRGARQVLSQAALNIAESFDYFDVWDDEKDSFLEADVIDTLTNISNRLEYTLYSVIASMHILGVDLENVCQSNLDLLARRKANNALKGSGDGDSDRGHVESND